ncbi:MAG: hypothetical protein OEZ34_08890 [Spirochaetia bacterium]|nr:hypothetical protein [Spirochaetia bacterium]
MKYFILSLFRSAAAIFFFVLMGSLFISVPYNDTGVLTLTKKESVYLYSFILYLPVSLVFFIHDLLRNKKPLHAFFILVINIVFVFFCFVITGYFLFIA